MVRLPWGWASGVITQDKQSQRLEEVPEGAMEQNFGGLKEFFKKQGILGQKRVRPRTREPLENPWAGHADFETPAPPTRSTFARSLDRSTRRFRHLAIAGGPSIPSCGQAFDRSAASHQPGGTPPLCPRVKLELSTSSETSSCDGHHIWKSRP